MNSTVNQRGLLQAIIEEPEDDALRMIYADWLEDQGQEDQAGFIREQCWLAQGRRHTDMLHLAHLNWLVPPMWRDVFEAGHWAWSGTGEMIVITLGNGRNHYDVNLEWHRGLIRKVEMSSYSFLEHGPALCQSHPIQEVKLTDKEPYSRIPYTWWRDMDYNDDDPHPPSSLPTCLFGPRGYRPNTHIIFNTRDEANAFLSQSCIQWARSHHAVPGPVT